MSSVSVSVVPGFPEIEIASVFVVVAAPHAVGESPKWSAPPETTSVALEPSPTTAVTVRVAASYAHDCGAAGAGPTSTAATTPAARNHM
jgi:hypothetical protein